MRRDHESTADPEDGDGRTVTAYAARADDDRAGGSAAATALLHAVRMADGRLSLSCRSRGVDLFLRWDAEAGELREMTRTSDGQLYAPTTAGPVRTRALLETAEWVGLVPTEETPFARLGHR